jgi:ribosomal protein L40E
VSATQCAFCDYLNPVGAKSCKKCNAPFHLAPCPFCTAVNDIAATSCYKCHAGLEPHTVRIFDTALDDDQDQKTLPDIVAHTRVGAAAAVSRMARTEPAMHAAPVPLAEAVGSAAGAQPAAAAPAGPLRAEPKLKTNRGPAIGVAVTALVVVAGIAFLALRSPSTKESTKENAPENAATAKTAPSRPIVTAPVAMPASPASQPVPANTNPSPTPQTAAPAINTNAPVAAAPAAPTKPAESASVKPAAPVAPPGSTAVVAKVAPANAAKTTGARRPAERAAKQRVAPAAYAPVTAPPVVPPLRRPPPPVCTEAVAALGLCPK